MNDAESVSQQSASVKGVEEDLDPPKGSLRSILLSVRDLEPSVEFYREVLHLEEVLREDQIAVLGGGRNGNFNLVLREADRGAGRSDEGLGLRTVCFDVGSFPELDRVEHRLRTREAFRDSASLNPPGTYRYVWGYDPDRQSLIFVAFAPGMTFSADHYRQIIGLVYAVDM
jgi:catechol 2,3-dioxygenase-like lactoylglutathione lyase family enzyme